MAAQRRKITKDELAKHNKDTDCWICVHDLVLDLKQDFLDEHPGGPEIVTALAGREATEGFEDVAHSDAARDWANKFVIGYIEGADDEAKTKMLPSASAWRADAGASMGGMSLLLPAALLVAAVAVAFVVLKPKS
mmetsp:Transcript_35910/g.102283  ORF Transcript_35910/g.102283 Transcript_35910/m.102283 type:complete len:135 (+) Transcript_35910:87-491(+)